MKTIVLVLILATLIGCATWEALVFPSRGDTEIYVFRDNTPEDIMIILTTDGKAWNLCGKKSEACAYKKQVGDKTYYVIVSPKPAGDAHAEQCLGHELWNVLRWKKGIGTMKWDETYQNFDKIFQH